VGGDLLCYIQNSCGGPIVRLFCIGLFCFIDIRFSYNDKSRCAIETLIYKYTRIPFLNITSYGMKVRVYRTFTPGREHRVHPHVQAQASGRRGSATMVYCLQIEIYITVVIYIFIFVYE